MNFELPNVPEDYVHRIGRTSRAGGSGSALSLVAPQEAALLKDIEKLLGHSLPLAILPPFAASAPRGSTAQPRGRGRHPGPRSDRRQPA